MKERLQKILSARGVASRRQEFPVFIRIDRKSTRPLAFRFSS